MNRLMLARALYDRLGIDFYDEESYVDDKRLETLLDLMREFNNAQVEARLQDPPPKDMQLCYLNMSYLDWFTPPMFRNKMPAESAEFANAIVRMCVKQSRRNFEEIVELNSATGKSIPVGGNPLRPV